MGTYVFVYGTLRYGERNHRIIAEEKLIAYQASIQGRMVDTELGFPAVVLDDSSWVYGEVYEVSEETLIKINALEGYEPKQDPYYERVQVEVKTDYGFLNAYTYYMVAHQVKEWSTIASGDWRLESILNRFRPYYFAYGSCMDTERIEQAGVLSEFDRMGRGQLSGFELQFTTHLPDGGRADIVEADDMVEGIVYQVTMWAIHYLYEREGVNVGRYRPAVVDVEFNGELHSMLTFIVIDKQEELAPPDHYLREILRGASPDVSSSYLAKVHERAALLRQPDEMGVEGEL
ncbi:gamma-glutamylcyclotransferase [Alkalibacillus sp. S2W]|uniref:gamma-glutamylcyclotransferase n=1 Tax=Alkalibacillus sp. S2W TaxID=3386553 RepID=UPI00398D3E40